MSGEEVDSFQGIPGASDCDIECPQSTERLQEERKNLTGKEEDVAAIRGAIYE